MPASKSSKPETDAARGYETLLVPALFGQWVGRVLDAAEVERGHRVLDVACGTGVLARAAAERCGSPGNVAGVDPNPGMLAVAAELEPEIDWREGVAESLPYSEESFDVVVSQFGLMFFSDRRRALREMGRVLAPGGRVSVAVWDTLENNSAYAAEVDLFDELAGKRAADALRAPFVLGDPAGLVEMFVDAGFEAPVLSTYSGTGRFPDIQTMVEADLRGWLPVLGVDLEEGLIRNILTEAESALGQYVATDGFAVFDVSAHIVSAARG